MANLRKINVGGVDYTLGLSDEQLAKLNGIAEGAQVNVIEAVKLNGKALSVVDKAVDIVLDNDVFKIVEELPSAPATGNENKIHVVPTAGGGTTGNTYSEYLWTGEKWELLGEFKADVDLTNYVQKEDGKGLSSNDFTDALKEKLEGLEEYDDTAVKGLITAEETRAKAAEEANAARIEQVAAGVNKVTFAVAEETLTITVADAPAKA